jgi:hypothetical protein
MTLTMISKKKEDKFVVYIKLKQSLAHSLNY